jgi:YVTN family beta-propeller protein
VHLDVSPDGSSLYVVNQKDDEVVKINTTSGALEGTYAFTGNILIKPHDVNVGPDGNLWVTDEGTDILSIIDFSLTGSLVNTITVGDRPIQVAFSVDGSQAFTTNYNDNTVSVIDIDTYTVTDTFSMGGGGAMGPMGVVVDPDGSRLWLSGTSGDTVHAHDLLGSPIGLGYTATTGLLGAHGLDISDDGNFLYTSVRYDSYSTGRDAIAVIDASDGSVVTTFYTPGATDLHGLAYVSAVPVPAAVWLFSSGLLGLLGVARSRRKGI